jgi:hypothetical protein
MDSKSKSVINNLGSQCTKLLTKLIASTKRKRRLLICQNNHKRFIKNGNNDSRVTEMNLYAQDNDLESDESTKKANQIVENIDRNKILSEIDESNKSHQIYPEQNFFNDPDIEISSIEAEARVETITEENEADSNFTTILNGSLDQSDFPDLEYVVHQMEIR